MLLSSTQVSLLFSLLIITLSALALFAAGAYLQHETTRNIRAIVKPRLHIRTAAPKWSLAQHLASDYTDTKDGKNSREGTAINVASVDDETRPDKDHRTALTFESKEEDEDDDWGD